MGMILVCPACAARFQASDNLFAAGPRRVRCAKCKHQWSATGASEDEIVVPPSAPPMAVPPAPPVADFSTDAVAHSPFVMAAQQAARHGGLLTRVSDKILLIAAFGLLMSLIAFLLGANQALMARFPALAPYYVALGFTPPALGYGLVIRNQQSEQKMDAGRMMLNVRGEVHNTTRIKQPVPPLEAAALDGNRQPITRWTMQPEPMAIDAGAVAVFSGTVPYPEQAVTELSLDFVTNEADKPADEEDKHDE